MVDYSKWDRLEVSSSDEDESCAKKMRVQRFAEKQRVTIGPQGVSIGEAESGEEEKGNKKWREGKKAEETHKKPGEPSSPQGTVAAASKAAAGALASGRGEKVVAPGSKKIVLKDMEAQQQEEDEGGSDEQELQKERRELAREKKAEEDEIDTGGDLEADEAFEDAHEWPRCGTLPSAVSHLDEDWLEEAEKGEQTKEGADERRRCKTSLLLGKDGQSTDRNKRDTPGAGGKTTEEGKSSSTSETSSSSSRSSDRRTAAETALIENGGVVDKKYFWSQSKHDVIVDVLLPWGARGKDVCCDIKEDSCCCTYKGKPVLKGDFPHKVEEDEEMWLWELVERKINWTRLQRIAREYNNSAAAATVASALPATQGHSGSGSRRDEGAADERQKEAAAEDQRHGKGVRVQGAEDTSKNVSDTTCTSSSSSSSITSNDESRRDEHKRSRAKPEGQQEGGGAEKSQEDTSGEKEITTPNKQEDEEVTMGEGGRTSQQDGKNKEKKEGEDEDAIFLELTLRKKPEVAGALVWWNAIVKGDPCINVQQIPGRMSKEKTTRDFKTAWERAHEMFFEKLKNEERQKILV